MPYGGNLSSDVLAKAWDKAVSTNRRQFNKFFENMIDGFAYHKIILDKTGKPVDYVFLEINKAFEELTGLKKEKVIGKRVTEVLKGIENDPADWIGTYGRVALTGEKVQFENHTEVLNKWFKVSAYSPERGYFVALFEDITERKKIEQELWQAKNDWERTFNTIPDFVAILDTNYRIVRANRPMAKQLGVTPEKAKGLICYEQIHGTTKPPEFCPHAQSLKDGKEHTAEMHEPRLGGDFIVSISPLKDEKGKMIGSVHVARNITDRKNAEEALRKLNEELEEHVRKRTEEVSKERHRLYNVLETLPAYVVLLDENYHMPFANKVFRELFGASHGKPCYNFLFGRDVPCENCETYKVLKNSSPHRWEWTGPNGRDYDIYDFPFVEADGSKLILEMGIDITERKKAEAKVRVASLYSRSLIEASLDPLVTISPDGKITDVNKSTEEVTGYTRNQLIGSDFSNYFTEPIKAREGYEQVFAKGFVKDYPLVIRHTSGRITDVLYNASVYKNKKGKIQGVFAAARDITDRKKAEAALQKANETLEQRVAKRTQELSKTTEITRKRAEELEELQHKLEKKAAEVEEYATHMEQLAQERAIRLKDAERLAAIGATAGMVGHDIRNPLQAIISELYLAKGELEEITREDIRNNLTESITNIENDIEYINKIVQDLQDFAKPLKPITKETDLESICNDILSKINVPPSIKVSVRIEEAAKQTFSDPDMLKRVIANLLTNAVQAMPEGGKLTLHIYQEADRTVVTVEDTGVGIPEEVKPKLFSPLFTTKSKGQGFGLAVVKRMTEALGGTVAFQSCEGKGTAFTVSIPIKQQEIKG